MARNVGDEGLTIVCRGPPDCRQTLPTPDGAGKVDAQPVTTQLLTVGVHGIWRPFVVAVSIPSVHLVHSALNIHLGFLECMKLIMMYE